MMKKGSFVDNKLQKSLENLLIGMSVEKPIPKDITKLSFRRHGKLTKHIQKRQVNDD